MSKPPERHQTVLDALAKGSTYREAGEGIGVTRECARQIAQLYGVKSSHVWFLTEEEKTETVRLYSKGMPIRHIAEIVGRNNVTLGEFLGREGLHEEVHRGPIAPRWSKREAATLKRLLRTHTFAAAAEEMGRTLGSVLGKAHRMGLCEANDCDRDENGWHIPAEGTQDRRVYDLMKAGVRFTEIIETIGGNKGTVSSSMSHIRHPDKRLHWNGVSRKRRAEERIL